MTASTRPGASAHQVSAHEHLRAATSAAHEAAEAALDLRRPVTVAVHRGVLELLLSVLAPVEDVLLRWQESHSALWQVQRRSHLAAADLRQLTGGMGVVVPPWPVVPPADGAGGAPEALGYAYALEGSRSGAVVIRKQLAHDRPDEPTSFFGPAEAGRWRSFLAVLDGTLAGERGRERAAVAAGSVFVELVSQAGRRSRG